jgi:hypothetical protein
MGPFWEQLMKAIKNSFGGHIPEKIRGKLSNIYKIIRTHLESSEYPNSNDIEIYLSTESNIVSNKVVTLLN